MDGNTEFMDFLKKCNSSDLVPALRKALDMFGYIAPETEKMISEALKIPYVQVESVRSFYTYLKTEKPAQFEIKLCNSTVCYVNGANQVIETFEKKLGIKAGECTPDNKFRLETVGCLGLCDRSPAVVVNGNVFGPVSAKHVETILDELK